MKCEQARELLWDKAMNALTGAALNALDEHVSQCAACAEELRLISDIRFSLRNPRAESIDESVSRALSKAKERIERDEKKHRFRARFLPFNPLAWPLAAVAVLVLVIIGVWPQQTSAVSLDKIASQHLICVKKGHFSNYKCNTEAEFAEKILLKLGFSPTTLSKKHHSFISGGVCEINDTMIAHALFKVDGSIVSHFHVKENDLKLSKNRTVKKIGDKIWRYSGRDYEMVIFKEKEGRYAIYVAQLPFEKLLEFTLGEHHPEF